MIFLLLSKQPHENFNVTGGKTTHDMNAAWWDKRFIVESPSHIVPAHTPSGRFIRPPFSLQSHDTNHTADHRLNRDVFLFSFPKFTLHSWQSNTTDDGKKKKTISCLRMYTSVVGEYWPPIFFQHKNKSPEQHFLSVCSLLPSSHFNSALNPLRQEKLC